MSTLISKICPFDLSNKFLNSKICPFDFPNDTFVRLISQMSTLISKICPFDFPNDTFDFQNLSV